MVETDIPTCQAPDRHPRRPAELPPAGAADTHAHVFGPARDYPYAPQRSYTPPDSPLAEYMALLDTLGLERGVIVHPSVYGTDNRATLDALRAEPRRLRGVAVVDADVSDAELEEMDRLGVRGVRLNLLYSGAGLEFGVAERLAKRLAPLGWHLQFLIDISTFEGFASRLSRLPVDCVIDHMGHMAAQKGADHPAFRDLLAMLGEGRTWVKLSGAYRLSSNDYPPYDDVLPFARALVETRPDRLVWASDWPHPAVTRPMPNDGDLLDLLWDWAPDAATRHRILCENPAALYGFEPLPEWGAS
jgi:predicted TIM-barrel fold metal-dependent hydrolase